MWSCLVMSVSCDRFIQAKQYPGQRGPGRLFLQGGVVRRIFVLFCDAQYMAGVELIRCKPFTLCADKLDEGGEFQICGRAC
jgi:hypothetical protein